VEILNHHKKNIPKCTQTNHIRRSVKIKSERRTMIGQLSQLILRETQLISKLIMFDSSTFIHYLLLWRNIRFKMITLLNNERNRTKLLKENLINLSKKWK
jgi:hypothetical protein